MHSRPKNWFCAKNFGIDCYCILKSWNMSNFWISISKLEFPRVCMEMYEFSRKSSNQRAVSMQSRNACFANIDYNVCFADVYMRMLLEKTNLNCGVLRVGIEKSLGGTFGEIHWVEFSPTALAMRSCGEIRLRRQLERTKIFGHSPWTVFSIKDVSGSDLR